MRLHLDDVDADGVRLGLLPLLPTLNVTLVYIPREQPLLLAAPGLSDAGQPRLHFRPTSDAGDAYYTVAKAALGPAVRKLQSTTRHRVIHDSDTVELVSVASLWSVLRHTPRVKVEVPPAAEPHPPGPALTRRPSAKPLSARDALRRNAPPLATRTAQG